MLGLFRKIRKEYLNHKRMSKYLIYATGEIFLVVIGILIALQINTWNQHRENRNELKILLRAFHIENQLNMEEISKRIEDCRLELAAQRNLLNLMGPEYQTKDPRLVDSLLFEGIGITPFEPNTASYKNLIASGKLKYITNDSLHQLLIGWDSGLEDLLNAEAILYHTFKTIVLPYFYDKISLASLDRQFAKGHKGLPPSQFDHDNRLVLTQMETENILEDHYFNMGKIEKRYVAFHKNLKLVNHLIDQELK